MSNEKIERTVHELKVGVLKEVMWNRLSQDNITTKDIDHALDTFIELTTPEVFNKEERIVLRTQMKRSMYDDNMHFIDYVNIMGALGYEVTITTTKKSQPEAAPVKELTVFDKFNMSIYQMFGRSDIANNLVNVHSIHYVGQLVALMASKVTQLSGVGNIGLVRISNQLRDHELSLGMDTTGWTGPQAKDNPLLNEDIQVLKLGERITGALYEVGIFYIGQLAWSKPNVILSLSGIGYARRNAIQDKLLSRGLWLGMDVSGWEAPKESDSILVKLMDLTIWDFFGRNYISGCLERNGNVKYMGQLLQMSAERVLAIDGIGEVSAKKIDKILAARDLSLGMKLPSWKVPFKTVAIPEGVTVEKLAEILSTTTHVVFAALDKHRILKKRVTDVLDPIQFGLVAHELGFIFKVTPPLMKEINISAPITIAELSNLLSVKSSDVIGVLIKHDYRCTLNQVLNFDLIELVCKEFNHKLVIK